MNKLSHHQITNHASSPLPDTIATTTLMGLLALKRPANTKGAMLAKTLICDAIKKITGVSPYIDEADNIIFDDRYDDNHSTLFSSHYDTVHVADDHNVVNQFSFSDDGNKIRAVDDVLGADDAAGIYVMLSMIEHQIAGLYIFHAAEEIGRIGSYFIAHKTPQLLDGIRHAVAFDRKGQSDVVYLQRNLPCASETCAKFIADQLNTHALNMGGSLNLNPSPNGSVTDTMMYRQLVPECLNISVGYWHEHTEKETLNLTFLNQLTQACCQLNWYDLPVFRTLAKEV
jgi:hypothetical protein